MLWDWSKTMEWNDLCTTHWEKFYLQNILCGGPGMPGVGKYTSQMFVHLQLQTSAMMKVKGKQRRSDSVVTLMNSVFRLLLQGNSSFQWKTQDLSRNFRFVAHNHLQRPNTCLPLVVIHLTQWHIWHFYFFVCGLTDGLEWVKDLAEP